MAAAAVATGAMAIPFTEAGPLGLACAYAAQPLPTRSAAGAALSLMLVMPLIPDMLLVAVDVDEPESSLLEHPVTRPAASTKPDAARVIRVAAVVRMFFLTVDGMSLPEWACSHSHSLPPAPRMGRAPRKLSGASRGACGAEALEIR
ncbi:hypothetical protein GOPIP_060_00160 [Gordonia polyisoprenivorans NBRC 16320 = JCM 10675]|nr:hypothetical protein GOPIP_060_00160 [Gordonia polyisoprenivorans NBRC 16320 = JCM 10675]